MKKHFVLALLSSALMLVACGVQTGDDELFAPMPPNSAAFGGVDGGPAADAGASRPDATAASSDTGGGKTDSGSSEPKSDAGGTVPDSGSDAADSGKPKPDASTPDSGVSDAGVADAATEAGSDAGADSGPADAGVVVPDNADVVRLTADRKTFLLSTRYIFSAKCGEVRGPMPGVGWSAGPQSCDTDSDGYFAYTPIAGTVGTYSFTYLDPNKPADGWALYGNIDLLRAMSPTARSFVECNWWDASTQKTVSVGNPSCSLKATFGANGLLAGAGNMANLQ